jgi:hypothetical protein
VFATRDPFFAMKELDIAFMGVHVVQIVNSIFEAAEETAFLIELRQADRLSEFTAPIARSEIPRRQRAGYRGRADIPANEPELLAAAENVQEMDR